MFEKVKGDCMNIRIARTNMEEAQELLNIQKQAFQSDLEKYRDFATNPAAESLISFIQRILISQHYTIFIDEEIAGSIDIRKISEDHYLLNQLCLNPKWQNRGFGSKIMKMMEEMFPNVTIWSLKTQKDNARNRHFYEKAGYFFIGEQRMTHQLSLVEHEKRLG